MSNLSAIQNFATRKTLSVAGLALIAGLTLQPSLVRAAQVNPRDFQAYGYNFQLQGDDHAQWRKPNGAEIWGGFYGADDEVNTQTGEVRHR